MTDKQMQWLGLLLYIGTTAGLSCGLALLLYQRWVLAAVVLIVALAALAGLVALGRHRRRAAH